MAPSSFASARLALGQLDHVGSRTHAADGAVLGRGRALPPGGELAGDRPLARVEPGDARQPAPHLLGIALVRRVGDRAALLARPVQPAALAQARLQRVGQRRQVLDVLARVAELLRGERPGVPAGEGGRLGEPDLEHVVQQPGVAGLGGVAGEARGDLRVEDVGERGVATPAAGWPRPGGRRAARPRPPDRRRGRRAERGRPCPRAGRGPRPRRRRPPARGTAAACSGPRGMNSVSMPSRPAARARSASATRSAGNGRPPAPRRPGASWRPRRRPGARGARAASRGPTP